MPITNHIVKEVIRKLLRSEDYRIEVITLIDDDFLSFVVAFFKKIFEAKISNESITADWYKTHLLSTDLPSRDIAIHAGLNQKTIHNMYNSSTKKIVIEASYEHYDALYAAIQELAAVNDDIDLALTIKFKGVGVDLNISESLIVINTLAVKRAALRGGLWSTVGKRVEKPLMIALCKLYGVPDKNYSCIQDKPVKGKNKVEREVDFYLIEGENRHRCEVKLMGKGNPEGADVVYARGTKVFIADTFSKKNIEQLEQENIAWIELRGEAGFKRFGKVMEDLHIPHTIPKEDIGKKLEKVLTDLISP